jgi:predicted deacylase
MGKEILEFGTAKAAPGERGTGYVKVGELSDGSPVNMPVIILNGKNPGSKLLVWALEDGDEYPGALGALDAVNNVLPDMLDEMNGSMVLLPATNISAFRGNPFGGGIRNSPLDIDLGARLPGKYPGNLHGKHTDQLAFEMQKITDAYDPDVRIRYHGCKQMYGWDRVLYTKSPPGSDLDNLARAAVVKPDVTVMLTFDRGDPEDRPLEISIESNGGDDGVGNGYNFELMRDGLLNVMRHLKMIPGDEISVANIQYVQYKRKETPEGVLSSGGITTKKGGFFTSLVEVKDKVKEGQVVGVVKNFFGEIVEEVKSPIDGVVLSRYIEAPHIGSGQWRVFAIAEPTEVR